MARFVYEGDEPHVVVGVAGAVYRRGQVEEVPDERMAAKLRTIPTFREVGVDEVPATPRRVSPMPDQGAPHPDPEISAMLRGRRGGQEGKLASAGNLNRDDQFEANTEMLQGVEEAKLEAASAAAPGGSPEAPEPQPEPSGQASPGGSAEKPPAKKK